MATPERFSEQVLDEATDWLVSLHSGEMTNEQYKEFEEWKSKNPANELAIKHVEQFISGFNQLPSNFQSNTLHHSKKDFNQTVKNNILLSTFSLFTVGVIIYFCPWDQWKADYHTNIGEIKTIPLQDGSKLVLASNSYVNIQFSNKVRAIELIKGEIYIETAKDQHKRPFIVETQYGNLEALGTEFTVRQEDDRTKLNVYQHAVAIHEKQTITPKVIYQGYRAVFNDKRMSKPIPLKNEHPYWTQHLIVAENWPLKKVLHELYRYRKGSFFVDKNIENIPISGVFSLTNIEQSLETIAQSKDLALTFYSPYLLHVTQN